MADQATEGLLSPYLKRQRIAAVRPHLKGRVLDIGCGSGALAAFVDSGSYVGIDIDAASITAARKNYPNHTFIQAERLENEHFDTVTALAVIEHVPDPAAFLRILKSNLAATPDSRIFCTTPHPAMDWVHWTGARIGLFSLSANDEHEELLDKNKLEKVGKDAGLKMTSYRRFLFGANQVFGYAHDD